jgi:hypothetical protein
MSDVTTVIDEMIDHIDYILAKTSDLSRHRVSR